jgi:molecular chaperone GrpE
MTAKKQPPTQKKSKPSKEDPHKKIKELTETLQRVQAEFENYKKRMEQEVQQSVKYSNEELIRQLLPILDELELATKNKCSAEEMHKGVSLIYSNLFNLLKSHGLQPIQALNQKFDPYKHEVLLTQKSNEEEGTVLEELQKGYTLNEKVIRHSKVKIAKK